MGKERDEVYMAVLATPKKNSYIIKKDCTSRIVASRTPNKQVKSMRERDSVIKTNNLKRG